ADVENGDVDLAMKDLAGFVQGGDRLEVAAVTRRRGAAVAEHDVAAAPRVEVLRGGVAKERISFLHHFLGRLPAADGGVELEELLGVDLALDEGTQAVL